MEMSRKIKEVFEERMDDDLDVKGAFDNIVVVVNSMDVKNLTPNTASGVITALNDIDEVFQVIF